MSGNKVSFPREKRIREIARGEGERKERENLGFSLSLIFFFSPSSARSYTRRNWLSPCGTRRWEPDGCVPTRIMWGFHIGGRMNRLDDGKKAAPYLARIITLDEVTPVPLRPARLVSTTLPIIVYIYAQQIVSFGFLAELVYDRKCILWSLPQIAVFHVLRLAKFAGAYAS